MKTTSPDRAPPRVPPVPNAPGAPQRDALLEPRLQIFCEEQGTATSAAQAMRDRRLAKLRVALHKGGVGAARTMFAASPTPDLVVVESLLEPGPMLAELETLSEVCDAGTKVVVIGHVNDVRLYRELMRRHISEYLVAPLSAAQFAEAIAGALADQAAQAPGRVIAFLGAKGGCGSSTICHNTGWTLAEMLGAQTIIADFDLAFGTLGLNFNQDLGKGIGEALAAGERLDGAMLDKLMSKCSERLTLLTPPCTLDTDPEIAPDRAAQLVQLMGRTASVAALDLPLDWRASTRALIAEADQLVITAEPDLANLRNAKTLIDAARALRATDRPPLLVLNKLNMPRRPEISARDFGNAVELEPAALIEFDAQLFGSAANNGVMIGEISAKSKPAELFRALGETLSGKTAAAPRQSGLLKPLMDRLSRGLAN
jgi:pilus assembly protein CpaE